MNNVARLETQVERWKLCRACKETDGAGNFLKKNEDGVSYCMYKELDLWQKLSRPEFACPKDRFGEEKEPKKAKKIILHTGLCAGDIVALLFAVESLQNAYPGEYIIDARTYHPAIFEGCPNVAVIPDADADAKIEMHYKTINFSNQHPYRYLMGYLNFLEDELKVKIPPAPWSGFLRIRKEEQCWFSAPREILGEDVPYWVVDAGYKTDYTAKQWEFSRFQKIVTACPDIVFVQIGAKEVNNIHKDLKGKNVINLIGKTDMRQLIRLIYNAFGVLTPVSLPMMLACAIPPHPRFQRKSRACIVLAGGREPNHWQEMANHQFLHACGMLPCCDLGGCWVDRVVPLNDDIEKERVDKKIPMTFCHFPTKTRSGQVIGKCMDMISAEDVVRLIRRYQDNLKWNSKKPNTASGDK